MDYEIREVQENETIIEPNSKVKWVYVILSGSVTKENARVEEDDDIMRRELVPPRFLSTLFDGEIFGLPTKVQ